MLISHFRHLEQVEGVPFGRVLILRGAEERLAPILMTGWLRHSPCFQWRSPAAVRVTKLNTPWLW